ncbi:MAG TPA: hypothetical protein VHL58_02315 [Thermoanaerobaculia bacterium]|nr:hypothetical protein [Thermoanaerobaculia bacterium]
MAKKEKSSEHQGGPVGGLATLLDPTTTGFEDAWVGMEPTFQSAKSVKKWREMSEEESGEDAYFVDEYMLGTLRKVARQIVKSWRKADKKNDPACFFDSVKRTKELDQWKDIRQNVTFRWDDKKRGDFEVKWSMDPETFEYGIKPVPLAWFYDERFIAFLEAFVWGIPLAAGLTPSMAHGGAQFSLSAKTFMGGSLLADTIADRLNRPELAMWLFDWPNADDRSFRATPERYSAFANVIEEYWSGAYHPRARGRELTPLDVYLDNAFMPAPGRAGLVDSKRGPIGSSREVFQTNFAFGRAVRLRAQNVHPGYWQAAHPAEIGYRPDQIMRYSEGNLNRLQIAGEYHVKSGEVLDPERLPAADGPLEQSMLYKEASWENRGQMGRTSARDFVEALLLDVHNARRLAQNPQVQVKAAGALLQDQILIDAEATVKKYAGDKALGNLHKTAEKENLESSRGRLRSDWIEPETLFWAAWKALPVQDKGAISAEIVESFAGYVENAREYDPRKPEGDPMVWHRHRVHPELWKALAAAKTSVRGDSLALRELDAFQAGEKLYLSLRPAFSPIDEPEPWK